MLIKLKATIVALSVLPSVFKKNYNTAVEYLQLKKEIDEKNKKIEILKKLLDAKLAS